MFLFAKITFKNPAGLCAALSLQKVFRYTGRLSPRIFTVLNFRPSGDSVHSHFSPSHFHHRKC